jgi:iron complex transport system substrate-binding protein
MFIRPEMHVKSRRGAAASVAPVTGARHLPYMRIASLLASATEIVCALGLGDALVAISHECDYPPEALVKPRVSRPRFDPAGMSSGAIDAAVRDAMARHAAVYVLDEERLRAVRPELILTQAVCDVCAVPTSLAREAARVLGPGVRVVSLDAHTLADVLACVRRVGEAAGAGAGARAAALVGALEARLARVGRAVAGARPPGVLAIEWLDPPFVPGHWVPEMIERAGGRCLAGTAGRPSRQASWDELAALDPDVLVVMPCGYGLPQARADARRHLAQLARVAPRALAGARAFVVDGSAYFNRSGPRVVDGVEILAALLHPECVRDVPLEGRAARISAGDQVHVATPRGARSEDRSLSADC